jgi:hypothetical protein
MESRVVKRVGLRRGGASGRIRLEGGGEIRLVPDVLACPRFGSDQLGLPVLVVPINRDVVPPPPRQEKGKGA